MRKTPGLAMLILLIACSPTRVAMTNDHTLTYLPGPLVIDGNANDWKHTPFTLDPSTTLRYALTNDSANLYVCLTSTNPGLERKIFEMGMKVYFDTSGERKEACGVQFPMPIDPNALQAIAAAGGNNPKTSAQEYRHFIRLQENQYETFGFPGRNGLNALGSQDVVSIGFSLDDEDIFIYELKVPLASIYGDPVPKTAFSKALDMGITIEGLPHSEDPNAPVASEIGQPGQNMTGARYNMGKGGGFARNPYGYTNETMFKAQRAWIRFIMATK